MDHGRVVRPMVPLFLGALGGSLVGAGIPPAAWGSAGLLAGSLAGGRSRFVALVLVGAALVGLLAWWQEVRAPGDVPRLLARRQPVDLRGVIAAPPEPWAAGWQFPLDLEAAGEGGWQRASGRVQLRVAVRERETMPGGPASLEPTGLAVGARVEVRAELRPLPSGGNPGLFSPGAWLARRGVAATGYVPDLRFVRPVEPGRGPRAVVEGLRQRLVERLFRRLPQERAALGAALLLGDRRWLPDSLEERMRGAGLGHLLAVSGMHVGILAGLAWWLAGGRRREPGTAARAGISLWLAALALLTGGAPSARRAVVMALIALWAPRGRLDPAQGVAAAGVALLLVDPLVAREMGFQLSFAATGGILLLGPRLGATLGRLAGRPGRSLGYGAAAAVGVSPLTAWHLGEVALWSVPATLVATPLLGVGLAGLLVLALLGDATPGLLTGAVDLVLRSLLAVADGISGLPGARWMVARPGPGALILAGGLLAWAARPGPRLLSRGFRWRRRALLLAALAGLAAWTGAREPGVLTVTVIDVGQGDSLLIQTPRGRTVLVDGGGWPAFGREPPPPDVGERVVVPFLRVLGMRRLDLVASTHPDADHSLGLRAVLESFPVGMVVHNGWIRPGAPVEILGSWRVEGEHLAQDHPGARKRGGIPHLALKAGDRIVLEPGITLTVLHPPVDAFLDRESNEASLVLLLERGAFRILLLADAEATTERALLARWGREGLRSDVVKLAHHGAASGAWLPFLEEVAPQVALVSVGEGNRYGHPHPETLAVLERLGVPLYRTDRDGALRVEVGEGWARLTALGRR